MYPAANVTLKRKFYAMRYSFRFPVLNGICQTFSFMQMSFLQFTAAADSPAPVVVCFVLFFFFSFSFSLYWACTGLDSRFLHYFTAHSPCLAASIFQSSYLKHSKWVLKTARWARGWEKEEEVVVKVGS